MPSLRTLRSFVAVARQGSFAAGAARVALTQAAVSLQMRNLEAELKRPLFDRGGQGGRRAQLNAAGQALLPWAERMLALDAQLHEELRGAALRADPMAGAYRIGAVVSAVASLAHAVVALKKEHAALELKLVSAKSGELAAMVESGALDAAVLVRGPGRVPAGLGWSPLYEEPLVLLAPAEEGRRRTAAQLLAEQPFLRFDRAERTGALVEQALRKLVKASVQEFLELNSIEALAELVRQRVGVALLPRLRRASWEQDPTLRMIALPELALTRGIGLLYRREVRGALTEAIARQFREL
jgi:DNA-binding transcriptional LysR family regulator